MIPERYTQACQDRWIGWKITALESLTHEDEAVRYAANMLIDECNRQLGSYHAKQSF